MFFWIEKSPYPHPDAYILKPDSHTDFDIDLWSNPALTGRFSSYAYACNCPYMGQTSPGNMIIDDKEGAPAPPEDAAAATLYYKNRIASDGLLLISKQHIPDNSCHAIALRHGIDGRTKCSNHIVLRRDSNGLWSWCRYYRWGRCQSYMAPTQLDFAGREITDPETAFFGSMTNFAGYASIPYAGIPFRRAYSPSCHIRTKHPVLAL